MPKRGFRSYLKCGQANTLVIAGDPGTRAQPTRVNSIVCRGRGSAGRRWAQVAEELGRRVQTAIVGSS